MGTQQKIFTSDDFNWNHEFDLPQQIVDQMTSEEAKRYKRLQLLVENDLATTEEIAEWKSNRFNSENTDGI
jgi:hypothetical protein